MCEQQTFNKTGDTSPMKTRFWLASGLTGAALVLLTVAGQQAGGATAPAITWSPSTNGTFDYGMVNVGQTASQEFTLTNSGGRASGTLTIAQSGSAAFTITADDCTGNSLGPGKTCGVTVEFAPTVAGSENAMVTATGEHASASLNLTGNGGALAARHIYWANSGSGAIGRADIDGTNVNENFIATGADFILDVAVDAQHIYWSDYDGPIGYDGSIGRADIDGTNVNQIFIETPGPYGVAVDAEHIYWGASCCASIGRANIDGTNVNEGFVFPVDFPTSVTVDAQHIYWPNLISQSIARADIDGTNVNQIFIETPGLYGVAVDAQHIYWTNHSGFSIGRADIDGTNVNQFFITGLIGGPISVAVDAQHIYWTDGFDGSIGRADIDGTNVDQSFITTNTVSIYGVAVDP
jgi:hypothetical protein